MTKKHFIALADHMRDVLTETIQDGTREFKNDQCEDVANELVSFCKSQNGGFNRGRWFGYLLGTNGPNGGKVS